MLKVKIKGKTRDFLVLFVHLLGLAFMKLADICTGKPHIIDYIKFKLHRKFNTRVISVDKYRGKLIFFLNINKKLSPIEKLYTAKAFGITMRNLKIIAVNEHLTKFVFLPKGMQIIQDFINTFPNYYEQLTGRKVVYDIDPEIPKVLTKEERIIKRRHIKQFWLAFWDIIDYVLSLPILGYLLLQLYWNRQKFAIIFDLFDFIPKVIKPVVYFMLVLFVILFFAATFNFWAILFCILLAGYGVNKIRRGVKIRIVK